MAKKPDLSKMSLKELTKLREEVDAAIDGFKNKQREEARKAIENVAKKHGLTVEEIVGTGPKRKKAKAAPKYRNPSDSKETWSGRGRQPRWFKDAIAKGAKPESMLI